MEQALVFTSTQRDADWLADRLADMGHHVASLHGGHPQGRRNRVLQGLRDGRLKILVATDVAARGIDVRTISHVINYGLPMKPEDYVHRIGRTGRAGATACDHARRAHGQRHDPSHPAVHDPGDAGDDDRRPRAQGAGAEDARHAPAALRGARGHPRRIAPTRAAVRRIAAARLRRPAPRAATVRPRAAGARRAPRSGTGRAPASFKRAASRARRVALRAAGERAAHDAARAASVVAAG
jgi:superfamily II DNA/RNA helicase